MSVYPDDDGGYLQVQLSNYYSSRLPLPGAAIPCKSKMPCGLIGSCLGIRRTLPAYG